MSASYGEKLKYAFLGAAFTALGFCSTSTSYSQDLMGGSKDQKPFKIDLKASCLRDSKDIESLAASISLRYIGGHKPIKFFMINMPYKIVSDGKHSAEGIGDISVIAGAGFKNSDWRILPYAGVNLPTGKNTGKSRTGNGTTDLKTGAMLNYSPKDFWELSGIVEYTFTGTSKDKKNSPNQVSLGAIAGRQLGKKVRAGAGLSGIIDSDKKYFTNSKLIFRYCISDSTQFQVSGDIGLKSSGIPKSNSLAVSIRRSF